ncbi:MULTISPECIES: helix-turn-helix transcriptional regulator [unclassified Paenibacillus]|uniref:helix-turn-helix transcriptional regulator n=1 Tax=unclassified Paenibacillus TaxID=185978 RepID=UPI001B621B56|nr:MULTISPECIES: helix-turn-helix transcriptional regulator [unclassified Paenibacillus]MBP1154869.1 putative transcriptional regulator YheO [Paenibacillus sp. PvP091]MBP1169747.1 putative transcriptional regulator YheO [Paenibacillus sp. PvR098]MBP2440775.1 putative transcriptional regulator YheO [Paenibacillus sp. PvP052]
MNHVGEEKKFLSSLMRGITAQFGDKCEVVLHDLTGGYEHTIVAIENGHITGRRVGDPGSNLGLEVLRGTVQDGDRYNYVTQTKDGRILRSTSIYIKNDENQTIGALCINFDISELLAAENTIKSLTMHSFDQEVRETFVTDVNELLDFLLQECQNEIGKPVSLMSKDEKSKAIEFLDRKGAFLIKKSGEKVCSFFDISKFTLYSILEGVRTE